VANEILYTTGGVSDWLAPPAYDVACTHKNRLIIAGLEDPFAWQCSSQARQGEQLRFNEEWGGRVPTATGPITACASLDDKLILFTASTFYVVFGDGPDLLGNNPFSDPQAVAGADSGSSSATVVETPNGIIFQSARGLCLLKRDLTVEYIGADVEAYGGSTLRAATLRPEVDQVWFHVDDGSDLTTHGTCLVWDYHYGQWSVLTSYGAQAACYYQGKYTRVRSDGVVFQEQSGTYTDSGSGYGWVLETSWIKPANLLQGFARLYEVLLVGQYNSNANLTWDAAYDYAGAPTSPTYNAADTITITGSGTFTVGDLFQVRRQMRIQKCEAVKFRFTESGSSGQGIGLTAMDLLIGIKGGTYKLPASKTVG
jgi:hypothetical protein